VHLTTTTSLGINTIDRTKKTGRRLLTRDGTPIATLSRSDEGGASSIKEWPDPELSSWAFKLIDLNRSETIRMGKEGSTSRTPSSLCPFEPRCLAHETSYCTTALSRCFQHETERWNPQGVYTQM
jgi:hypothetical protein